MLGRWKKKRTLFKTDRKRWRTRNVVPVLLCMFMILAARDVCPFPITCFHILHVRRCFGINTRKSWKDPGPLMPTTYKVEDQGSLSWLLETSRLKVVVSIGWFQIFTMGTWLFQPHAHPLEKKHGKKGGLFHHFHTLRNACLGFQVEIPWATTRVTVHSLYSNNRGTMMVGFRLRSSEPSSGGQWKV